MSIMRSLAAYISVGGVSMIRLSGSGTWGKSRRVTKKKIHRPAAASPSSRRLK
jgi:hypothetical protein